MEGVIKGKYFVVITFNPAYRFDVLYEQQYISCIGY